MYQSNRCIGLDNHSSQHVPLASFLFNMSQRFFGAFFPDLPNLFRRTFHFGELVDVLLVALLFSVEGLAVAIEERRFNSNDDDDDLDLSV